MAHMVDEKLNLIIQNLQEIIDGDTAIEKIREIIVERPLRIYWGIAPTGRPHIGYFVPIVKIADFLAAGCHVQILFADLHAYLDNEKNPTNTWQIVGYRTRFYEEIVKAMLESIDVPLDKLEFVRGSEFQHDREYNFDAYKLMSNVSEQVAKIASSEVVKQSTNPKLSSLVYPILQALDEQYLGVDVQFGGIDQRKIFAFAEEHLPLIGYQKRIHLMNYLLPTFSNPNDNFNKMSASHNDALSLSEKIDCLDGEDVVNEKIKKAYCAATTCGLLEFARLVLFPVYGKLIIMANDYSDYSNLNADYMANKISTINLKNAIAFYLNRLLEPIRTKFSAPKMQELIQRAYPDLMNIKNSI